MNSQKLKKIITKLKTGQEPLDSFDTLDQGIRSLTKKVGNKLKAESLDSVNKRLDEFQKQIDLSPLTNAIEELKSSSGGVYQELGNKLQAQFDEIKNTLKNGLNRLASAEDTAFSNSREITAIKEDFKGKVGILEALSSKDSEIEAYIGDLKDNFSSLIKDLDVQLAKQAKGNSAITSEITNVKDAVEKLRLDTLKLFGSVGAGNANRNVAVGGNTSVLSMFTDINLKAGSGITLTYTNNQTTKYTDITIASNGGSSGITREINTTTVSSVVGSVAGIDYITLVNAGAKITLPPATGNDNLYTIKNIGVSSVLIVADGAETFDGDANIIMPVRYTSVDIISDGSNWHIT